MGRKELRINLLKQHGKFNMVASSTKFHSLKMDLNTGSKKQHGKFNIGVWVHGNSAESEISSMVDLTNGS